MKGLALLLFFLLAGAVEGQNVENLVSKANQHFRKKNYKEAIPLYLKVEKAMPNDHIAADELYYALAYSYFYSDTGKERSVPYFEKFLQLTDTVYEPHFLLGQMYQYMHKYDKALERYEIFKKLVESDSVSDKVLLAEIKRTLGRQMASCNYGITLMANPIKAFDQNLGDSLNTVFSEYAPAITPHEEKMVFTRRSPQTTGGKIAPDGDYFEDIYLCDILEGRLMSEFKFDSSTYIGYMNKLARMKFSSPVGMGPTINSASHEGGVTFSADARRLFLYKDLKVWESEEKEGTWQAPHLMEGLSTLLRKQSYEPSISLSTDEKTVYIACEQPGGYGGLDLYRSVKVNGVWSALENLGPQINTLEDEDSPYIDPDGAHLYFSSKGHSSMGGYDIFRTEFDGKNWTVPSNLGYPVNSAGDDIFFVMPLRYNRGYYSSNKIGGKGKMDLYRVTFADLRPTFAEVHGKVLKGKKYKHAFSKLSIHDPTLKHITYYESDSLGNDYLMLVPHGKQVLLKVETPDFSPVEKLFLIPEKVDFFQFYQEIHQVYLYDRKGRIVGQMLTVLSTDYNSRLIDSLREDDGKLGEHFLNYLNSVGPNDSIYKNVILDVKYYFPEDSILKLARVDSSIRRSYPPKTEISFAWNPKYIKGKLKPLPTEFVKLKNFIIDKESGFIFFNLNFPLDSLEKVIDPVKDSLVVKDKEEMPVIVITFDFESATLAGEFTDQLDVLIRFMKKNTNFNFEISGHTDSKGDDAYNLNLSRQRARAVKNYMVSKGIAAGRLTTVGKGAKEPIAANENADGSDNPEGRKTNRRIQFRVIKQ